MSAFGQKRTFATQARARDHPVAIEFPKTSQRIEQASYVVVFPRNVPVLTTALTHK